MDSFGSKMNPRSLVESEKGMLWEPSVTESGGGGGGVGEGGGWRKVWRKKKREEKQASLELVFMAVSHPPHPGLWWLLVTHPTPASDDC